MSATAESGYGDLVRWACQEVFPSITRERQAALIGLSDRIEQEACLRVLQCALEFHHDGSSRVDPLFHTQSRRLAVSEIALPAWWPALVEGSDPTDGTEVFGEERAERGALPESVAEPEPTLSLGGFHWLEFVQGVSGDLSLAGLFQYCHATEPRNPLLWNRVLDHFHRVECLPGHDLHRSESLRLLFDAFGMPFQWGFMVGRAAEAKVVVGLDGVEAERVRDFLGKVGLDAAFGDARDLSAWCTMVASPAQHLSFALSLDVDLARDRFVPAIGLEVVGPRFRGVKQDAAGIRAALEPLLERSGVDRDASASLHSVLQTLPRAQSEQTECGGLEAFLAEELRTLLRFAYHLHLKLVFRPTRKPTVKNYVMLQTLRGLVHPGS
jgi:hypothetical protein